MEDKYHPIQRKILSDLLYSPQLNFASLKPVEMEGSQFTFHLSKLLDAQLIEKTYEGKYVLTLTGKNVANQFDPESPAPTKQAKHSVVFCATRHDQTEFLMYTRLKNPFYGCQGFPAGKLRYGESVQAGAEREFHEETNLTGQALLRGIRHFRVYDKHTNKLLEDKVMYIHEIKDPVGELRSNHEGEFYWVRKSEIDEVIINPLEETGEFIEILTSAGPVDFKEVSQYTEKF